MLPDLTNLSEDDLIELNRLIVERLQLLRSARSLAQLARLSVGMTVEFDTDDGRTIRGDGCASESTDGHRGDRIRTVASQPLALASSGRRAARRRSGIGPTTRSVRLWRRSGRGSC